MTFVLEDTLYRALRFAGEPVPTLRALDTAGRVVHLGSFSKILAPGLRLGWVAAAPELLEPLGLLKLAADTQTATLSMSVAARLLTDFDLDEHIAVIRERYGHKRDLMVTTMRETFPGEVSFTEPDGGLFTWVTFPEGFDAADFMARVALPQARVAYVPGTTFFPVRQEANHARFSYSGVADDVMVDALGRLGSCSAPSCPRADPRADAPRRRRRRSGSAAARPRTPRARARPSPPSGRA